MYGLYYSYSLTQDRFNSGKGKKHIITGSTANGKTTLLKQRVREFYVSFIQPRERLRYEIDPSILADEVIAVAEKTTGKPLVIVDEVQKVPAIMGKAKNILFLILGSGVLQPGKVRAYPPSRWDICSSNLSD